MLYIACHAIAVARGGSRNFEKGGQFEVTKKRSTVFLKLNQCSFSDHGLIDDSMTYIVARDSRNGWNHLALQLQSLQLEMSACDMLQ